MSKIHFILVFILFPGILVAQKWKDEYDYVTPKAKEGFYLARRGAEWSFVNEAGKKLTAETFTAVSEFQEGVSIAKQGNGYVLVTLKGRIIQPEKEFTFIKGFKDGYSQVMEGNKISFINKEGKLFSFDKYYNVYPPADGLCLVWETGKGYGCINLNGEEIIAPRYSAPFHFTNGRAIVQEGKDYIVINKKGEKILTQLPQGIFNEFIVTREFINGAAVFKDNKGYGLADTAGHILIHGEYEKILPLENSLFQVKKNEKYGCVDAGGKLVIPVEYEHIYFIDKNLLAAKKEKKYGLINAQNKTIVNFDYEHVDGRFNEGVLNVKKNGRYGAIDALGKTVLPFDFDLIGVLPNGLFKVEKDKRYGVIDRKGNTIIPFDYDYLSGGETGYFAAKKNGNYGIIDLKETVVVPFEYKYIDPTFYMGTAVVSNGVKYGLVDLKNNMLIPTNSTSISCIQQECMVNAYVQARDYARQNKIEFPGLWKKEFTPAKKYENPKVAALGPKDIYDKVLEFSEGMAAVRKGNKWGFIDKLNKLVVPVQFDNYTGYYVKELYIFKDGIAKVCLNNRFGLVNKEGKLVAPCIYDALGTIAEGMVEASIKGKGTGFLNAAGKEAVPLKYGSYYVSFQGTSIFSQGLAPVVDNKNKYGYVNKQGAEVIPLKYDMAFPFKDGKAQVGMNKAPNAPLKTMEVNDGIYSYLNLFYIDTKGNVIDSLGASNKSTVPVSSKYIFEIDLQPTYKAPYKIVNAGATSTGVEGEYIGGKWGVIDEKGKIIVPINFGGILIDTAQKVFKVYALSLFKQFNKITNQIRLDTAVKTKFGYFDFLGKELTPAIIAEGTKQVTGDFIIKDAFSNLFGVVNSKYKMIISPQYELIYNFTDSVVALKKNGKFGAINLKHEILLPFEFNEVFGGQLNSGISYIFKNATATVNLDLKGKISKQENNSQPAASQTSLLDNQFQTEFAAATNSKARGQALGNYIIKVYPTVDSITMLSLVRQKVEQVAKVDFYAIYESSSANNFNVQKFFPFIRNALNQKQREMISKYSNRVLENFSRKYSQNLPPLPEPPTECLQPGQPWRE